MRKHGITGRSHRRKTTMAERRQRVRNKLAKSRDARVSDILRITPTKGLGENLASATALQRARAAAERHNKNTPRPKSRLSWLKGRKDDMSWLAAHADQLPSPHGSRLDWTLEDEAVGTDADDEYDEEEWKEEDEDEDNYVDTDEEPLPEPTRSDLDFIVDEVPDGRDETYVQTEPEDDGEEERQLVLMLSRGKLHGRIARAMTARLWLLAGSMSAWACNQWH